MCAPLREKGRRESLRRVHGERRGYLLCQNILLVRFNGSGREGLQCKASNQPDSDWEKFKIDLRRTETGGARGKTMGERRQRREQSKRGEKGKKEEGGRR